MPAKLHGEVKMEVVPDEYGDASWLEQEGLGFEDRLAAYRAGEFGLIGVQAVATVYIPHGSDYIIQEIRSPGLWGIESDSGDEYLQEVYTSEVEVLNAMLRELGVNA